jgi:hypothetical protein
VRGRALRLLGYGDEDDAGLEVVTGEEVGIPTAAGP